jgi:hypothetical protein
MTDTLHDPRIQDRSPRLPAWLAIGGLFGLTAMALRLEGRRWWCRCGRLVPWSGDIWSEHNSQHLLDPYTFTHVEHGLLLYALLRPLGRWIGPDHRLVLALGLEALWEVLENTQPAIERYRKTATAQGYAGDSVANSLADLAACALGLLLARWLPIGWSVALLLAIEAGLLAVYRDNFLLTVVMPIWPVKSIQSWQMGRVRS